MIKRDSKAGFKIGKHCLYESDINNGIVGKVKFGDIVLEIPYDNVEGSIKDAYLKIEAARNDLYQTLQDIKIKLNGLSGKNIIDSGYILPNDIWTAHKTPQGIKITVPDYPPILGLFGNKPNDTVKDIMNRWQLNTIKAIQGLGIKEVYSKVFVLIKIYLNGPKVWDVDNRYVKPIIDGVRYSGLIKDDSYDVLSFAYAVEGVLDRENHTEIYIINSEVLDVLSSVYPMSN